MLTIIFIFSMFSIGAMIGLKMIEEKRREKLFFSGARERADEKLVKITENAKNRLSILSGKNGKRFAMIIRNAILYAVSNIKRKTYLKKIKFLDSLKKTNGNLKKKGSASFFLKNVSEYKGKYIK